MKIVGFTASPRKAGNTAWIVEKILEGAEERGAETRSWHFADLDIEPCRGCYGCKRGDRCVIEDDMHQLYDGIRNADALVFGSPLYIGQMTAQAKTFTDRWFSQFNPRSATPQPQERSAAKKLILVFTQGNPDSSFFQTYYDYTKTVFQLIGFDVKDLVVVTGMQNGPARERAELHTRMKEIGSSLIP